MKKKTAVLLTILIIISIATISVNGAENYSNLSDTQTLSFTNNNFENMTEEEIFAQKLSKIGVSEDFGNVLSRTSFDSIVDSNYLSIEWSYYIQDIENEIFVKKSKEEYEEVVSDVKAAIAQTKTNLALFESKKNANSLTRTTITSPGVTETVDRGTLTIGILLASNDNINFSCAGLFQWTTMPSTRGPDALGLSRGDHITVEPQSASGAYDITYEKTVTNGTTTVTEITESTDVNFGALKASSTGYAMEIQLISDASSVGTSPEYFAIKCTDVIGALSYDGEVNEPNAITSINHFLVYAHQKLGLTGGINFSIPFSVNFTISGLSKYEQINDEHKWSRL